MVAFDVYGTPGPQGSKKAIPLKDKVTGAFTGKVNMIESSRKVKPWRVEVAKAAKAFVTKPFEGGVNVSITFYLDRPKKHYRTGRFAHMVSDRAPLYPETRPDLDKLVRATLDALTAAGTYTDDSKVIDLHVSKRYADNRAPGAHIQLIAKADTRALTGRAAA